MVEIKSEPLVGIVVPTTGDRPDYLSLSLKSIRDAGDAYVILVASKGFSGEKLLKQGLVNECLEEPEPSITAAINFGIRKMPKSVKFVNWLGDDDLLTPGSINRATKTLTKTPSAIMVFGGCEYIGPEGETIFTNRSGQWAVNLMKIGPQLIPQPGALFRRSAFEEVGGLARNLGWAFDFDLFLSLSRLGRIAYIPEVLAKFRWHPGSLSVGRRRSSVAEASSVRKSHLPPSIRVISEVWEWPVRKATYLAGVRVSKRVQKSRLGSKGK